MVASLLLAMASKQAKARCSGEAQIINDPANDPVRDGRPVVEDKVPLQLSGLGVHVARRRRRKSYLVH